VEAHRTAGFAGEGHFMNDAFVPFEIKIGGANTLTIPLIQNKVRRGVVINTPSLVPVAAGTRTPAILRALVVQRLQPAKTSRR
jgi:hypothetical protein